MTRVEISKARKLKRKDFNKTYLKKILQVLRIHNASSFRSDCMDPFISWSC